MHTKLKIVAHSAIIALGLVTGATSSNAQTQSTAIRVLFGDLDTSTPAGARVHAGKDWPPP